MSFTEIKDSITELTVEERLELAAWIAHLNRADDPAYQAELDRRMSDMDRGEKFDRAHLERMHEELSAKGL